MGFLYLMMGVIISSAVLPATLTLMWSGQNKWAATLSPPLGLACSLITWLVVAKKQGGTLSVATLGANNPMLAGNVVALLSPCIFIPVLTLIFGLDHYDWASMGAIRKGDDHDLAADAGVDLELVPGATNVSEAEMAEETRMLNRASVIAKTMTLILTISLLVLWPIPMYASSYVFSQKFFTGWVVVGIMWLFFSLFCVGIYPLWEGRHSMAHTFTAIFKDITGKGHPGKFHAHGADITEGKETDGKIDGVDTPPTKEVTEKVHESEVPS